MRWMRAINSQTRCFQRICNERERKFDELMSTKKRERENRVRQWNTRWWCVDVWNTRTSKTKFAYAFYELNRSMCLSIYVLSIVCWIVDVMFDVVQWEWNSEHDTNKSRSKCSIMSNLAQIFQQERILMLHLWKKLPNDFVWWFISSLID